MKRGGKNHRLLISSLRLGCFAPTKMLRKVKKKKRNTSTVKRAFGGKKPFLSSIRCLSLSLSLSDPLFCCLSLHLRNVPSECLRGGILRGWRVEGMMVVVDVCVEGKTSFGSERKHYTDEPTSRKILITLKHQHHAT